MDTKHKFCLGALVTLVVILIVTIIYYLKPVGPFSPKNKEKYVGDCKKNFCKNCLPVARKNCPDIPKLLDSYNSGELTENTNLPPRKPQGKWAWDQSYTGTCPNWTPTKPVVEEFLPEKKNQKVDNCAGLPDIGNWIDLDGAQIGPGAWQFSTPFGGNDCYWVPNTEDGPYSWNQSEKRWYSNKKVQDLAKAPIPVQIQWADNEILCGSNCCEPAEIGSNRKLSQCPISLNQLGTEQEDALSCSFAKDKDGNAGGGNPTIQNFIPSKTATYTLPSEGPGKPQQIKNRCVPSDQVDPGGGGGGIDPLDPRVFIPCDQYSKQICKRGSTEANKPYADQYCKNIGYRNCNWDSQTNKCGCEN